ncbi:MAG: vitamin B12-dependent ribonucleotide reductase, partial [Erysipelotrichaceae bacterium]
MYKQQLIDQLNADIERFFPLITPIKPSFHTTHEGVSRLVMLDRYAQKDRGLKSLAVGNLVVTIVKEDPVFPSRGIGIVVALDKENQTAVVELEEEWRASLEEASEIQSGQITRKWSAIDKPLELFFEQIAGRVGHALAASEKSEPLRAEYGARFSEQIAKMNTIPAGRVLYGAGSGTQVTYFNCFVMPFIKDSRGGIAEHRKEVMEIMSRGGGVGTNGSSLRPKACVAKGVGGRSSGAVSWLNDLANLTNLVEQGGSRRGAQMIMMADWHPDIFEFIISKMQNPKVLKWLSDHSNNANIRKLASDKLKFIPLSKQEVELYESVLSNPTASEQLLDLAQDKLLDKGAYEVVNPHFLNGANISVTISDELMDAIQNDGDFALRFPDLDVLDEEQKNFYDAHWHEMGDVREWERLGYPVKTYQKIKARDLWDLINFCATYSAEPGIFFIDNANKMTNARGYGQKVVATNPCGEQPLAPYSVCNLSAINLANFVDRFTGQIKYEELKECVSLTVRMQDNVIDSTPYFLKANQEQALGERRIGLGVMGLHDMMIWANVRYGSKESLALIDDVFGTIAMSAYTTSVELAKEKGSFPYLSDRDAFVESGYLQSLPQSLRDEILKYGIRNSHLLTIAPTGSTGTMVGVSTGLEPYFSFSYYRSGRLGKHIEVNAKIVDDYLQIHPQFSKATLPSTFVSAMELTPQEHVNVQCAIQRWIDSSISKTVNAPRGYSVRQVQTIYESLYQGGAKGGTVYVDGSRDTQVLSLTNDE